MGGEVWVPVLLLAGVVMVWATWPRRARSVDAAEARRQAAEDREREYEVAPGRLAQRSPGRGYRTLEEQWALLEQRHDPIDTPDGPRRPPGRHDRR